MADSSSPIDNAAWRKSSYSGGTTANCVEVGEVEGVVLVRDSTLRESRTLNFDRVAWSEFLAPL